LITVAGETRPWKDVVVRVRELITKALELNPNSSEAHTAQGDFAMQVDHRWDLAEGEFQQAIALNPSNAQARVHYGWLLMYLQRIAEARKQFLAAIEQDPLNFLPRGSLQATCVADGRLGAAIPLAEKLLMDFPDNPGIRSGVGVCYALVGRSEDALKMVEPLVNASDFSSRWNRAFVLALLGRPEEARALLAEWEAGRLPGLFVARYAAVLHAAVGENESALTLLEDDDRHGEKTLWNVYQNYVFDPIRDDPRFVAMLRGLNLPTTLSRPRWSPGRNLPT
jgi:tetratricopeptide (TPR) repeat protein